MKEELANSISLIRKQMKEDIGRNWLNILTVMIEKVLKFKDKMAMVHMATILKLLS